jgi:hypothetical protein
MAGKSHIFIDPTDVSQWNTDCVRSGSVCSGGRKEGVVPSLRLHEACLLVARIKIMSGRLRFWRGREEKNPSHQGQQRWLGEGRV